MTCSRPPSETELGFKAQTWWTLEHPTLNQPLPDGTGRLSSASWDLAFMAAGEQQGAGPWWSLSFQGSGWGCGRGARLVWCQRARVGDSLLGCILHTLQWMDPCSLPRHPGKEVIRIISMWTWRSGPWLFRGQVASGARATGATAGLVIQEHGYSGPCPQGLTLRCRPLGGWQSLGLADMSQG